MVRFANLLVRLQDAMILTGRHYMALAVYKLRLVLQHEYILVSITKTIEHRILPGPRIMVFSLEFASVLTLKMNIRIIMKGNINLFLSFMFNVFSFI